MAKKRILVIGSSGMLGMDLCKELKSAYEVYGADIIGSRGKVQGASKRVKKFFACDITKRQNVEEVIRKARPDIVILTAAYTDVDGCERDPKRARLVNADGPRIVARACRQRDIPLVFISTDFVFNGRKRSPYLETDAVAPLSVYGESKLQGEKAIRAETRAHVIVRTSWLYGKHGKNFVDTIIAKAKAEAALRVVDDQVGSPTYTKDLAKALRQLIDAVLKTRNVRFKVQGARVNELWGTYHCSNAGSVSWYDYAKAILRLAGLKTRITPISSGELARPAKRPAMSVMSCEKLRRSTGIRMCSWKAALEDYIKN